MPATAAARPGVMPAPACVCAVSTRACWRGCLLLAARVCNGAAIQIIVSWTMHAAGSGSALGVDAAGGCSQLDMLLGCVLCCVVCCSPLSWMLLGGGSALEHPGNAAVHQTSSRRVVAVVVIGGACRVCMCVGLCVVTLELHMGHVVQGAGTCTLP